MKKSFILCLFILFLSQTLWLGSDTAAKQRKIDVEGTIEVQYEDYEGASSQTTYYLNTGTQRFELRMKSGVTLQTGARIRVQGRLRKDRLNVESAEVVQTVQTTIAQDLGEQRQLVMLFNFQDQPNNRPWTADYVRNLIFTDVNQYWQSVSYGQTWITGDFAGWYTIPVNSTDCAANRTQAAENGARALGFDPDTYSHKIYIYPSTSCASSGGTTWVSTDSLGNVKTWVYISGSATSYILTHEFGHTLGFRHSNSLSCGGVTFGTGCTHVEYGDHYDVMGYYNNGVANSYQRDLAEWLGSRIQSVTSDGTYTLTPTGLNDNSLKAIKIPQSYDPTTGSTTYYYLEYRQPVGYDSFLSSYSGVTNGVLLRLGTIGNDLNRIGLGSELLDATPTLAGANEALAVGRSYTDPAIPMTVTVLSANSAGATVSVQFSAPTCTRNNPTVAISPPNGPPSAPGTTVPYTVTVTNNDSSSCAASSFNLQASVSGGWTANFTNPTLTVSPGASASRTLMVTSPSSASSGSYNVGVAATNSSSSTSSGSASASYVVASTLGVALSTDRSIYTRRQWVTMMATVSANGSPVQGAGVSFTMTKSNGTVVTQTATTGPNGSASVQFQTKRNDPVGMYQGRGIANSNGVSGMGSATFAVQ
jgi:hypothetical protein